MATSGSNPREIQDKDKKAEASVQHPGMPGDAGIRVPEKKSGDTKAEPQKLRSIK
jgi:hypothetical protein